MFGDEVLVEGGDGALFAAYTPIDQCVGKEVRVRTGGAEYVGMLAGIYTTGDIVMMVLTPMNGSMEQHIPLQSAVVSVKL